MFNVPMEAIVAWAKRMKTLPVALLQALNQNHLSQSLNITLHSTKNVKNSKSA
jgi:hypothetical protein